MSLKASRKLSSKKNKPLKDSPQAGILKKLGLEACWTTPLDPASMLDISTWTLENQAAAHPKDLPKAFLHRLWLLSPDARSPCCKLPPNSQNDANTSPVETLSESGGQSHCAIDPLDLVAAVYMSCHTFLQQEITSRMVQCQFAVPLVLPNIDPVEPSQFLLWPLRGVVGQWKSHFPGEMGKDQEGYLPSTHMPVVSCVRLGHCSVSKSQVLNHVISGRKPCKETFLHRGMDGGQLPRRIANGLVEIAWYRPTGHTTDIFPVPLVISNLRGDARAHEKCLSLLCQASSAVVLFCGNLDEKERQILSTCKNTARSLIILIDLSDAQQNGNTVVGFGDRDSDAQMELPRGSVVQGQALSEEELANRLRVTLKDLLPAKLQLVTLEAAANLAVELGLKVDEGAVCKNAMATVENMLKGLDEGPAQFREKQLPLQGHLWRKLAQTEKEESKLRREGKEIDPRLLEEKKDVLVELSTYKMTPVMKMFTDVLFTTDKVERTYFLTWMKLRLHQKQSEKQNGPQHVFTANPPSEQKDKHSDELHNGISDDTEHSDSLCTDSLIEEATSGLSVKTEAQVSEQLYNGQPWSEEALKSTHDPVMKLQLSVASNKKDIQGEGTAENKVCVKEQISDPVSEDQSCQTDQQDQPKVIPAKSDCSLEAHPASCPQPSETDPSWLGLEHFLREMGLIFELKQMSPGSGSHDVLRLPSIAADLLLYGIPLEIMDGDASNIPAHWLSCVFAEFRRRLPQQQCRTRVLTSMGAYHARNAEVLSAVFGVKFPDGRKRSTRGVYVIILCLPENLRKDMECDFLLLVDVEGLCMISQDNKRDSEMATVATGLSNVLLQNISSRADSEFETDFTVMANALLCIKEYGTLPVCQVMTQGEDIKSLLQASQLKRVSEMLQPVTGDRGTDENCAAETTSCFIYVNGPWSNVYPSESGNEQYSKAVLKLKKNLFGAVKRSVAKSEAPGLPEFITHLCAVWEAVKSESFTIGLHNAGIALAFSLLCTEHSQWEDVALKHLDGWLMAATQKMFATRAKALDVEIQNGILSDLKVEGREEVKTQVDRIRSKAEAYLTKDDLLQMHTETFRPILMSNMDNFQEQTAEEIIQRLETAGESFCSSTQLRTFETLLEKERESKLQELLEKSRFSEVLLEDSELEQVFDGVWTEALSNFDFRSSETDNITARVTDILKENLISRGLQKHMKKLEAIGQQQTSSLQVTDKHFGYRSRLKRMFEDNNRGQRLQAQQVACHIVDEYNRFVAEKTSLPADFSDSYVIELLENVERVLIERSMEIRTAFEVDVKVYLCRAACQDFQKVHDRYAKDAELLRCIAASKSTYMAEFIYEFRKKDQCQRVAEAFTSMVVKPTVLDYIYRPLETRIVEEITKEKCYESPRAFHQSLLEGLIKEDFESFQEYLLSFDSFRLRKIQERVIAHVAELSTLDKWRQQRLGEIVGRVAAAVSQAAEGTSAGLSDSKPLLERVCSILERDGDVHVNRAPLDGPLFSITTEWDRFVTCVMEWSASMRLDLAQEFSQNMDVAQLLQCLRVQPQHSILSSVRGCGKQCPLCGAPCEVEEMGHEVHRAVLHRPTGMLPYDPSSLSSIIQRESLTQAKSDQTKDAHGTHLACRSLHSNYVDWNIFPEDSALCVYWRYVLARFNEKLAQKYEKKPVTIPEEWKKITEEEALHALQEVFLTKPC